MPEKDPAAFGLITYVWVVGLAAWGGVVNFMRKRKAGDSRPFNIAELLGEIVTSGFSGLLTFWLCAWSNTPPLLSAVMIGISGHMGGRAIFILERWAEARFTGGTK